MPEEIFDDEMESLAMDILEGRREDIHIYAQSRVDDVAFDCKSVENQAFVLYHPPTGSRIHGFALPYQSFDPEEVKFEHERELSRSHTECFLCGGNGPDSKYEYKESEHHLHEECADKHNKALKELQEKLDPQHQEIKSNIVAGNV